MSWRRDGRRLHAVLQQLRCYGVPSAAEKPIIVSSSVASSVSSVSPRVTKLPEDVLAAFESIAAKVKGKDMRQKSVRLTDQLKQSSRTKHRGGMHPNLHDEHVSLPRRVLRGNRRQLEKRELAALSQLPSGPAEGPNPEFIHQWRANADPALALLKSAQALAQEAATAATQASLYTEGNALAYAAARMPACFAALHSVFLEIKRAAGLGWRPRTVLDFGSGPGTAAWALADAWGGGTGMDVLAVEPSQHMAWIGGTIQQHCQENHEEWVRTAAAKLTDGPSLAATAVEQDSGNDGSTEDDSRGHVPPPNVRWISKLPPLHARNQVKKHDIVVAAYVLGELGSDSERQARVIDLWGRTGQYLVLVEPGTPSGSANILAARRMVLDRTDGEAHVVAPCPHDGKCPLEGRSSWCHFVQRFERPGTLRKAKATVHGLPPRPHQDERYSYVVLASGPRKVKALRSVQVSGVLPVEDSEAADAVEAEGVAPIGGGWSEAAETDGDEEMLNSTHLASTDLGTEDLASTGLGTEVAVLQSDLEASAVHQESSSEGEEGNELRQMLLDSIGLDDDDATGDGDSPTALVIKQELQQLLQDAAALKAAQNSAIVAENTPESAIDTTNSRFGGGLMPSSRREEHAPSPLEEEPIGEAGEAAEAAAVASSATWSRLLRPPRKRSGHIILDVCSAHDAGGRYMGGTEGALLRQIVSKGKAVKATGGTAAVRMARKARWGDLWPADYQLRLGASAPPPTATESDL